MTDINEHEDLPTQPEPALVEDTNELAQVIDAEVKLARKSKVKAAEAAVAGAAVVSGGMYDDVSLDRCVFKNIYAKKSLTVHHLQRRLSELGYSDALTDRDGWYGDITRDAVASWQSDNNIEGDGTMTAETFKKIFDGDINVNVII
jgi:peptidoglycan hydrolase-like protein with peptidoglycan-binding domain